MKRFHVHVGVEDLEQNIRFYTGLFGTGPSVVKPDYAKWMLDDPRLNFAISQRGGKVGIDHIGLQTDSDEELQGLAEQMKAGDMTLTSQKGTACCYMQSDKHWTVDPQGIPWETFHSLKDVPRFNDDDAPQAKETSCCAPVGGGCC